MAWRTGTGMGRGTGCPPTGTRYDGLSRSVCSSRLAAKLRVAISRQYLMSRDTERCPKATSGPCILRGLPLSRCAPATLAQDLLTKISQALIVDHALRP